MHQGRQQIHARVGCTIHRGCVVCACAIEEAGAAAAVSWIVGGVFAVSTHSGSGWQAGGCRPQESLKKAENTDFPLAPGSAGPGWKGCWTP
jgi:hypothetical protein